MLHKYKVILTLICVHVNEIVGERMGYGLLEKC